MMKKGIMASGEIIVPSDVQELMESLHDYLMQIGFSYSSISVIYRPQDLGVHCIFSSDAKDKITDDVKYFIKSHKASYSINQK